jgi:hypothetical protein
MLGTAYRWLLLPPLLRAWAITILLGGLGLATLTVSPSVPARPAAPALAAGEPENAAWPRAAVRLWFLLPQILPLPAR